MFCGRPLGASKIQIETIFIFLNPFKSKLRLSSFIDEVIYGVKREIFSYLENGLMLVWPKGLACQFTLMLNKLTSFPDVDECATLKPCKNGARCQNTRGTYICACVQRFFGKNCDQSTLSYGLIKHYLSQKSEISNVLSISRLYRVLLLEARLLNDFLR